MDVRLRAEAALPCVYFILSYSRTARLSSSFTPKTASRSFCLAGVRSIRIRSKLCTIIVRMRVKLQSTRATNKVPNIIRLRPHGKVSLFCTILCSQSARMYACMDLITSGNNVWFILVLYKFDGTILNAFLGKRNAKSLYHKKFTEIE